MNYFFTFKKNCDKVIQKEKTVILSNKSESEFIHNDRYRVEVWEDYMKDKRYAGIIMAIFMVALTAFTIWGTDFLSTFGAAEKEAMDVAGAEGIKEASKVVDKDGNATGYEVVVTPAGFGGEIELTIQFDADGETVTGYEVGTHSETPGLGAKISEDEFKGQFNNVKAPVFVKDMENEGTEVQAITGATISSKAVATGVNNAYNFIASNK